MKIALKTNFLVGLLDLTALILTFLTLSTPICPLDNFLIKHNSVSFHLIGTYCKTSNNLRMIAIRVREYQRKPVSFKIKTATFPSTNQYISDVGGNKKYQMIELGDHCHYHTNSMSIRPLFIFTLQQGEHPANRCQITRIISYPDLQPCAGKQTEDIFDVLKPQTQNYHPAPLDAIKVMTYSSNYRFPHFMTGYAVVTNYQIAEIDERMMVLQPMMKFGFGENATKLYYSGIEKNNNYRNFSLFALEINPGKVIRRITKDNLPGYFLDVYNEASDETEKVLQKVTNRHFFDSKNHHSSLLDMFFAKPAEIALGETLVIECTTRPASLHSDEPPQMLKLLKYEIEISRSTSSLGFQVKREAGSHNYFAIEYTGGDEFIYFTCTV